MGVFDGRKCLCGAPNMAKGCRVKPPCDHKRMVTCCAFDEKSGVTEQWWACHGCGKSGRGDVPAKIRKEMKP